MSKPLCDADYITPSLAKKSNIMVIGAGGVGTMAAFALEKSGCALVTAVLRSNYATVLQRGFEIESVDYGKISGWKPSSIVPDVTAGVDPETPYDYVVVTMKNLPDVYSIPNIIRPAISAQTSIVLIQNGLYIEEPIMKAFPGCTIISGVSMIGAHQYDGKIIHDDPDDLLLGVYPNPNLPQGLQHAKLQHFAQIYGTAAPLCKIVPDIIWSRWRKLIWNGTFNTLCALTGLDCSLIRYYGGENLLRPAMEELYAIAKADGHLLPADIVETMINIEPLDVFFRPSMLVDVDKGNPIEIEVILGTPLKIAKKLCVPAPVLDSTYKMLKLVQCRNLAKKGLLEVPKEVPLYRGS